MTSCKRYTEQELQQLLSDGIAEPQRERIANEYEIAEASLIKPTNKVDLSFLSEVE